MFGNRAITSVVVSIGAFSAGTEPIFRAPAGGRLLSASLLDGTAVAKDNTNYITIEVKNGSTSMASGSNQGASGNWIEANGGAALTLASSASDLNFSAGDVLTIVGTDTGTGTDLTTGYIQLDLLFDTEV
ncbi:MAG: hypothetical protein ACE5LX_05465 [Nitrospinota bacterium]